PADLQVLDKLGAIPTKNEGGTFTEIPLTSYTGTNFPTDATRSNFAIVNTVSVVTPSADALTYSMVKNTNPSLVTATIKDNRLTLQPVGAQTGTATITIRATDGLGAFVETTFTVTVS